MTTSRRANEPSRLVRCTPWLYAPPQPLSLGFTACTAPSLIACSPTGFSFRNPWMNLHHSTLLVKFLRVFAALNPSNFQGNWSLHEMKIVQRTNQVFENYHLRGGGGELKGFWLCHDKNYLIPYKALWYSYEQHPHLHYPSILCWRQLISPSVIPTTPPPPPPPHTHTHAQSSTSSSGDYDFTTGL